MGRPTTILIADDHVLFAQSLSAWLAEIPDLRVLGVATTGEETVNRAVELQPDIILMDIDMPGLICFEAARIVTQRLPNCAVVFVSAFTHDHYIEQALAVKCAGYIVKKEPPESIVAAVSAVMNGGVYFSPELRARLIVDSGGVRLANPWQTRLAALTRRELETLRLLARGLSKKRVAELLGVSVKTVDTHTANLMDKLDIHDRVELTRFAIREGLAEA